MNRKNKLNILRYNVRKSRDTVMATLLRDERIREYDILAIQEPWRNPFASTTHHPAKENFHLCYPQTETNAPARVCFFVNKRLDSTKWQFESNTRDTCTIKIAYGEENENREVLVIHNIYNPVRGAEGRNSVLPLIDQLLAKHRACEQIVLGDFNLHHSLWGGLKVMQADPEAEQLIELMARFALENTLVPGTITYEEGLSRSTIDLCLVTVGLVDRVIRSEVDLDLDHNSDHLPISTSLDLTVQCQQRQATRNWKKLDEEKFRKALGHLLPALSRPRTKTALDQYTTHIVQAIQQATEEALPISNPSPRAKEGWTEECTSVLAEAKRLRRAYNQYHTEESWESYRMARNKKTRTIKKALKKAHRCRVEEAAASPESLWKLAKWAKTRGHNSPTVTPAIQHPVTRQDMVEVEDKAEVFRETFFPSSPEANLDDIENAQYANQVEFPSITKKEVTDAIRATAPLKAPGPDGIRNRALQAGSALLVPHLTRLFNQSLQLEYCPDHFRTSHTVVLRKPGKDNYTVPKAYRPIALLNTVGKIMDAVIARRLSYLAETYQVLPQLHIGGRRQRSVEHAIHAILEKVHEAWNTGQGQVASLLLLDVSGAFDNVSHKRLLHNLRKRRVDETTVRWIGSWLQDRRSQILLDGWTSKEYSVNTGTPQGSPLPPLLYIFYNADLIEECNAEEGVMSTGYIDDAATLAWANTTEETCKQLERVLEKAQRWATTHASVFAPEKFQLVHFTRSRSRIKVDRPVQTAWGEIQPTSTAKYLGVIMDTQLRWKAHTEDIRCRTTKTLNALSALGGSTWGASMVDMRKLYRGVIVPQMMYACSVWSNSSTAGKAYTRKTLETLKSVQAQAARTICGAFRATSQAALDVEAYLLPVEQQIWKHNVTTLGRILSCQDIPQLMQFKHRAATTQSRRSRRAKEYISPLQSIYLGAMDKMDTNLEKLEQIPAFVVPPWWQGPNVFIEANGEKAQARHDKEATKSGVVSIYTDGSCINHHVGAAAVLPQTGEIRKSYMGTDEVSTVYVAELQGIRLALEIAQEQLCPSDPRRQLTIYTDNQAAIRSTARPEGRCGAYILKVIMQQIQNVQARGWTVTVRWINSHAGIPGNEEADTAAKEATGWRAGDTVGDRAECPQDLFPLKSTLKTWCNKKAKKAWIESWRTETKGRASFRYTPVPSKRVLHLHQGRSKRHSALLVQLRTEKIGFDDFLYRRRVPGVPDPMCQCGEGRQTVTHILLRCRKLKDLRRQEFGRMPGRHNLRVILNKRELATKAIRFVEQTQILGQFRIAEE